ncbi:hypothetical protein ACHAWF_008839 [Thalassiosira exigua]
MVGMSSLQKRSLAAAKPTSKAKDISFESCFSAGLDLAEFSNEPRGESRGVIPASAALAQRKFAAAAKRNEEEKQEAVLEQRVAVVVESAKSQVCSGQLGSVVPRALNPNSRDHVVGRGRDDNFVQFEDETLGGGTGFLSSLVSNHQSEGLPEDMSHKSRTLIRHKNRSKKQTMVAARSRGTSVKDRQNAGTGLRGKVVAKKTRKSKY